MIIDGQVIGATEWQLDNLERCGFLANKTLDGAFFNRFLEADCECGLIQSLRYNHTHVECGPFPVDHSLYIQIVYCLTYALLVFAALAGNLTVVWWVQKKKWRALFCLHVLLFFTGLFFDINACEPL